LRRPPDYDPHQPITYPRREREQRPVGKEKAEPPIGPAPPIKKKKEDNPLLMRTGAVLTLEPA